MASPKDELSAACNRQMELAEQCFETGVAAIQRMLMLQMDGARQLFELQGQQFAGLEAEAGDAKTAPWLAFFRRAVAGSTEASMVCFRVYSALQMEATRLVEEIVPGINRSLAGNMERATQSVLTVAGQAAEAARKRAA
jgi:hypothetical protein